MRLYKALNLLSYCFFSQHFRNDYVRFLRISLFIHSNHRSNILYHRCECDILLVQPGIIKNHQGRDKHKHFMSWKFAEIVFCQNIRIQNLATRVVSAKAYPGLYTPPALGNLSESRNTRGLKAWWNVQGYEYKMTRCEKAVSTLLSLAG